MLSSLLWKFRWNWHLLLLQGCWIQQLLGYFFIIFNEDGIIKQCLKEEHEIEGRKVGVKDNKQQNKGMTNRGKTGVVQLGSKNAGTIKATVTPTTSRPIPQKLPTLLWPCRIRRMPITRRIPEGCLWRVSKFPKVQR